MPKLKVTGDSPKKLRNAPCSNGRHILHPGHDLTPEGADLVVCVRRQHQFHALHPRPLSWHGVLVLLALPWGKEGDEGGDKTESFFI